MQKFLKQTVVSVLTWEARLILKRRKPFIIAVTGSVGKTTTKDAIFHVLKDTTSVRKSEKSFNSELGVPLTILGLPNAWKSPFLWALYMKIGFWRAVFGRVYPKVLVLEVGADHPGDIARLTKWLKPDIAVMTRLAETPVHVEYFSSPDEVRKEKGELVRALNNGGMFIANGDDPYVREWCSATTARTILFGFSKGADVQGSDPEVRYGTIAEGEHIPLGMTFRVEWKGTQFPVSINGVLGTQSGAAILAALAVGVAQGESMERMIKVLATFETPIGRMRLIQGKSDAVLIDDTYNSSPTAAKAALETLRTIHAKRRIAILGDMLELGGFTEDEHKKIGRIAGEFVDMLLVVGNRAKWIAEGALQGLGKEKIHEFTDAETAGKWMAEHIHPGDVILAKGSQGSGANMIRMERAVKLLMAHPEDASEFLVRQEEEWSRH